MTGRTPEQIAAGARCIYHADIVQVMVSLGDVDGAHAYLSKIEQAEGEQLVRNVTDLIALRLGLIPPEMLPGKDG
ncbi:hypothetical protein [Kutzneria buriramensis]|uniref:Uncharacterized protein n=1 Tax=Kutzneria buriramensis TaxID=1045776 RepID=A0A3E0HEG0_9PSEU|nr:hypothetical protein [Kutzneria buriramensis]REH43659.1 hypothetical protein BCF44_109202 [Kutzneria buriramensis]